MTKRVALALGSGGARGYAHVGIINELRSRGYEPVGVAGSSMGALVGGVYAAGALAEFTAWAQTLTQRSVLRLLDPSLTAPGVFRAGKFLDAVREMLGETTIETLPIPYTAVTTDLLAGKSVWLQRGPLDEAIRASIAIPGVIAPHVLDGRLLADGGILDPLPIAPIAAVNADLTVAVSVSGVETDGDDADVRPTRERLNRLRRGTSALLDRLSIATDPDYPRAYCGLARHRAHDEVVEIAAAVLDDPRDGAAPVRLMGGQVLLAESLDGDQHLPPHLAQLVEHELLEPGHRRRLLSIRAPPAVAVGEAGPRAGLCRCPLPLCPRRPRRGGARSAPVVGRRRWRGWPPRQPVP